jgi:hypothetical protein
MTKSEIESEIKSIHEKLDRILLLLEGKPKPEETKAQKSSTQKQKLPPLTQEDINAYKEKFDDLYEKWLSGKENEVTSELDKFGADDIRRFADANNLNVTSKMPKDKVLNLIGARFREKKQLFRNGG